MLRRPRRPEDLHRSLWMSTRIDTGQLTQPFSNAQVGIALTWSSSVNRIGSALAAMIEVLFGEKHPPTPRRRKRRRRLKHFDQVTKSDYAITRSRQNRGDRKEKVLGVELNVLG